MKLKSWKSPKKKRTAMSINKAVACIKKYKAFLIASHTNMEGDALGSELAFYRLIKKLGKRAVILNEDDVPYGYDFLPGLKAIRKFRKNIKGLEFDCFAVLDCSDLRRTGDVYTVNKNKATILNIDHHISNARFATVNWVEPYASCTCEMIYKLYRRLKVKIDKEAALYLYAGILTDTGSFRYTNTSALTHKITADLLRCGVRPLEVYKNVYGNIPFADLKLFTRILPTMQRIARGKVVYFQIAKKMLRKNLCFDLSENILTFARMIKDIEVAVLFKENLGPRNEVRVNFRSQGKIDVNKIAQFFGGGGHKTASGATVKGRLAEVKRRVLNKIKAEFKDESLIRSKAG
jgi:phosphoesterase RecJ-like protein